jgi:hypothetical protein
MYKPQDFRKGCPVCCAISQSLTKKNCDFCKAELVIFENIYESKFSGFNNTLEWKFESQKSTKPSKTKGA